ncbi:hypothetical protein DH2020_027648 [Rehmannia glutinosa]|uniref:Uncharacterized protein n=1 Tax=Rehmannia glutinosa TaxID=99300 RepID=A0ABR0VTM7_REHGL
MNHYCLSLAIVLAVTQATIVCGNGNMKSERLCSQCTACDTNKCPPSEAYPHMTAFDDSLVAGALQSDYVSSKDRGVYSVPDIKGGASTENNSYFGWESTSGSASGYHRNYMDKCSDESYLTVDKHDSGFLIVQESVLQFLGKTEKRTVGVAGCELMAPTRSSCYLPLPLPQRLLLLRKVQPVID